MQFVNTIYKVIKSNSILIFVLIFTEQPPRSTWPPTGWLAILDNGLRTSLRRFLSDRFETGVPSCPGLARCVTETRNAVASLMGSFRAYILWTLSEARSRLDRSQILQVNMGLNSYLVRKEDWEEGTWRETEKWKFEQKTVAITYILRELLFDIAQLSTARQE